MGLGRSRTMISLLRFGRGFEEISKCAFVGVERHADILNVVDDCVETGHFFRCGAALGVGIAVDAVDLRACGRIFRVADVCGVELAGDAVLGAEDGRELEAWRMSEDVGGTMSLSHRSRSGW